MNRIVFPVFVLIVGAWSLHGAAQQRPQPNPAERGAELLSLTFTVAGPDGSPVTDLQPAEVKIRLSGRERVVRSLQLISVAGPAVGGSQGVVQLPPPFATNASSSAGRTMVLAVDQDSLRAGGEAPLRQATDALIAGLNPADRVALVALPFGAVKVPLTTDHSRLHLAMQQTVGQAPSAETGSEMACRTRRTLEALAAFLESLGVRDTPMTMMFVTAALAAPRRDAVSALAPGMCELSEDLFTRVSNAAGAARAQFYVVRPDTSTRTEGVQVQSNTGSDNPLAGIEHVTGVTGGKLLALAGSGGTAFERILRETSVYYRATIDIERNDRSGRWQQLDIRLVRKGAELRSTPRITFAADSATAKVAWPSLRDMLTTTRSFRDLPLRAAGFPALAADAQNIRVVTLAEAIEPDVKLASMGAALFNADGKLIAQWIATPEELQRTPVAGAMSAPPSGYRLRVAAIDASGRSGATDYEMTAEIVRSGPLKLSSLVLGLSRGGVFTPKLQFTTEPLAVGYIELEGAPQGARLSAGLEVSQSSNGPALVTVPLTIENTGPNRYTATGSIPLGALPAGDYVVRAMIGLEGHPMTRVVRTIRKVLPALP